MNKQQLIEHVADQAGINKKTAGEAVAAVLDGIQNTLSDGENVTLTGFGTFEVRQRQARQGVKPGTTEKIQIPASKYPAFKPGKTFKDAIK